MVLQNKYLPLTNRFNPEAVKMKKMNTICYGLQLQSDLNNNQIRIVKGFEVDYSPEIADKDFNDGGTWGKILNKGVPVLSIDFLPNKTEPNFGKSDYEVKYAWMMKQMQVFQGMDGIAVDYFASCKFHVMPNQSMYNQQ